MKPNNLRLRPSAPPDVAITIGDEREIKYDDDYDIIKYIPLYMGLVKGELEKVKAFLDKDPAAAYARVSTIGETSMHIAISHGNVKLVEELLKRMETISDLSGDEKAGKLFVKDGYGDTPLHIAARAANTTISEALVNDNPEWIVSLSGNPDADEELPFNLSAIYHNWDLLVSLVNCSRILWPLDTSNFPNWSMFSEFINCEIFEEANDIGDILKWGSGPMDFKDGLYTMADMVSVFSPPGYFKRLIYYCKYIFIYLINFSLYS
ncbi:uncharacterized protein LOC132273344 [Cornus florida]|uniref:uncharacterized protein LOC132273344 n=1 Tax=Cornus florida TaxID=4283 RepID=UPI00289F940C|nr:uncharacterized protein LOC132273344 [Cornus florida]